MEAFKILSKCQVGEDILPNQWMQHQVWVIKSSGVGQAAAVGVNGQVGAAASLPFNGNLDDGNL